jgi:hypothetical protein
VVIPNAPGGAPGTFAIARDRVSCADGNSATSHSADCPPNPAGGCSPDWSTDLGAPATGMAGIGHGEAVYTSDSGKPAVLDVATSTVRGTAPASSPFLDMSLVAVGDGTIVVAARGNVAASQVVAFRAAGCGAPTCAPVWPAALSEAPAAHRRRHRRPGHRLRVARPPRLAPSLRRPRSRPGARP